MANLLHQHALVQHLAHWRPCLLHQASADGFYLESYIHRLSIAHDWIRDLHSPANELIGMCMWQCTVRLEDCTGRSVSAARE